MEAGFLVVLREELDVMDMLVCCEGRCWEVIACRVDDADMFEWSFSWGLRCVIMVLGWVLMIFSHPRCVHEAFFESPLWVSEWDTANLLDANISSQPDKSLRGHGSCVGFDKE